MKTFIIAVICILCSAVLGIVMNKVMDTDDKND